MRGSPRLSEWFWPLVESFKNNERKMTAAIRAMPKRRLVAFYRQFRTAAGWVNPQYWDDAEEQFGSEDVNKDFSSWVVSRGLDYYHRVRTRHWELKTHYDRFYKVDGGFHDPLVIAVNVFYEQFEGEIVLLAFPR